MNKGKNEEGMSRREFLKQAAFAAAAISLAPVLPVKSLAASLPKSTSGKVAAKPEIIVAHGADPTLLVNKAIEAIGGMKRFVKKGDVVVIKPNIGWDRLPEQAADTNPDVVAALVRLVLAAGAKTVKVFDRPCNTAIACYKRSKIEQKAKAAGAVVEQIDNRKFRNVKFPGCKFLKEWLLYGEALDADCLINVPIAKHHNSVGLTMALKNNMGIIGGNRGYYHRSLARAIAELNTQVKVHLTILDAYRILLRNGPQGGSLKDVRMMGQVIVGTDPVAVDAYGATLFGKKPEDVAYLPIAKELGIGECDLSKIRIRKVKAV